MKSIVMVLFIDDQVDNGEYYGYIYFLVDETLKSISF